jgi:hypothetical protein
VILGSLYLPPGVPDKRGVSSGRPKGRRSATQEVNRLAKDHGSSVKDDEQYEGLRRRGMSKQRAARIANAPKSSQRKGGKKGGKKSGKKS